MKIHVCAILCALSLVTNAQDKSPAKFGKIAPEDFQPKAYAIDSSAHAVVLADIGSTDFIGNSKGWFSLEYKRFRRARILNKNGYEIAEEEIPLYESNDGEEEVWNLKAVTYNLEDGKVVETKLDTKNAVFKDKLTKNWSVKKFTFPNIKEGSIIEFEYTVKSDFLFNLQPWTFQGEYPELWSEYKVRIPQFFGYVTLTQGYQPFFINTSKNKNENYSIRDDSEIHSHSVSVSSNAVEQRWVIKDVPAIKEEHYTTSISNHLSKLSFQLSEYREPLTPKRIMGTWFQASEELMKDERFGLPLTKENGWMNDEYKEAIASASTDLDRAKSIFKYIQTNMTCTRHSGLYTDGNLKNLLKKRNGSEAEINLLLTAMLKKAGLEANPVILSTRSNGYTYDAYPILDKFNYVIAQVTLGDKDYYLDASRPELGFGRIAAECYNGYARTINATRPYTIYLAADSLKESAITSVFINNQDGASLGTISQSPGYFESASLRSEIKEKGRDQLFEKYRKGFSWETEIQNPTIDSLDKNEMPLAIKYDFKLETNNEDILYVNPMLARGYKENPFKSATRNYPVEMPYATDEMFLLRMEIPEGYKVEELPKQTRVKLNENNDGMFEYLITESQGVISFRSRIQLKRAFYAPDEYDMLREFYNLIVQKHAEQIVFKKKK